MSDIEFLSIKEFDSKLREDEGSLSGATGDLATLTANTGKDMYLARAKCSVSNVTTGTNARTATVELKVNGVIHETVTLGADDPGADASHRVGVYEFVTSGVKVAAGQIIKLEGISVDVDVVVEGVITCFEEDTGLTPQV